MGASEIFRSSLFLQCRLGIDIYVFACVRACVRVCSLDECGCSAGSIGPRGQGSYSYSQEVAYFDAKGHKEPNRTQVHAGLFAAIGTMTHFLWHPYVTFVQSGLHHDDEVACLVIQRISIYAWYGLHCDNDLFCYDLFAGCAYPRWCGHGSLPLLVGARDGQGHGDLGDGCVQGVTQAAFKTFNVMPSPPISAHLLR